MEVLDSTASSLLSEITDVAQIDTYVNLASQSSLRSHVWDDGEIPSPQTKGNRGDLRPPWFYQISQISDTVSYISTQGVVLL